MATRQEAALKRQRHPDTGQFVQRTNGHTIDGPKLPTPVGISPSLMRILRPQAAFRWILPNIAAITPQYIEMVMRGALAGNHVQQWELFDLMMDTWPELSACYQELVYGVLSKKLVFEPYCYEDEPPEPEAIDRMKLVRSALRQMAPTADRDENALDGCIKDLLDGWLRGITVQEVLWGPLEDDDIGQIMAPRSTFWVHPVAYGFNADGQLGLRTVGPEWRGDYGNAYGPRNNPTRQPYPFSYLSAQPQPAVLEPFPAFKFLIGIHKAKSGTALGGPLLRPLCWWWVAANFCSDWLLNLAQLFGIPFRYANYDVNAPDDTIVRIQEMLQNMGSSGYAAFPSGTEINFQDVGAGRNSEYTPQGTLLDRADRYARLLILGQTMTGETMSGGKGGQAFGVVEKDVKQERIDAAGKYACEIINKQLIPSILLLNYGDDREAPLVRLLEENEGQFVDAQRDQILLKMGVEMGQDFVRKKYGIPEPSDDEELLTQPAAAPSTPFGQPSTDDGAPQDLRKSQPGMEKGDKAMEAAAGAYAVGHPFYGNQYARLGDWVRTPHGIGVVVNSEPDHAWVSHDGGNIMRLHRSQITKIEKGKSSFPSITHSAENDRRILRNLGIKTKQGPSDIYIVRHGCTALNGEEEDQSPDIIRGHMDVPLTQKGREQAAAVGEKLKGRGITKIFASDLSRAHDTADIIASKFKTRPTIITLRGLRPWALGPNIEGKPTDEVKGQIQNYIDTPEVGPEGGESFNTFSHRFLRALHHVKDDHADSNIAVVTHYRGIKMIEATKGGDEPFDKDEFNRYSDGVPPGGMFKLTGEIK